LSPDERFEILKNERRRIVLQYLVDENETVKLNKLADEVTAIENETAVEAITSEERKRVYVGLYQFHLPKMAKMGVIEYDQDRGDITLTETGEVLCQEYSSEEQSDSSWEHVSMAAVALGMGGIIAGLLVQSWLVSALVLSLQTAMLSVVLLRRSQFPTA
jgi:hypothetical protein